MKLTIDTSNSEKIILELDENVYDTEAKHEKSQRLLPFLQEVLEKEGKSFIDISSIDFKEGKGSFTGIRLGASVANALGFLLDIPINGKSLKDGISKLDYDS